MISLEQCKKIDPTLERLTDEELTEVRKDLYELGSILFNMWQREKFPNFHHGLLQNQEEESRITNYE